MFGIFYFILLCFTSFHFVSFRFVSFYFLFCIFYIIFYILYSSNQKEPVPDPLGQELASHDNMYGRNFIPKKLKIVSKTVKFLLFSCNFTQKKVVNISPVQAVGRLWPVGLWTYVCCNLHHSNQKGNSIHRHSTRHFYS